MKLGKIFTVICVGALLFFYQAADPVFAYQAWQPNLNESTVSQVKLDPLNIFSVYLFDVDNLDENNLPVEFGLLLNPGLLESETVTFTSAGGSHTASWQGNETIPVTTVTLGSSNSFGFFFRPSVGEDIYTYNIAPDGVNYKITIPGVAENLMTMKTFDASPVPIPGSIAILVAGLMSLVGLGTRRNKSKM